MRPSSDSSLWSVVAGAAIVVISESATLAGIRFFGQWNTPICWTGFILFADGIVRRRRGASWLTDAPREFAALALASIPLWLVFELYNRFLHNWHYVGLPDSEPVRLFGYAWAFATIWPAVFEAADLVGAFRTRASEADGEAAREPTSRHAPPGLPALLSIAAGAAMLASPFVVSPAVARYLAAPVWLGFIFVLDPINDRLGADSLLRDLRRRRFDRIWNLILAGFLCGFLWEFWNYWSLAKWHYTVPIMADVRIFEMPLPGYLGFPPFALECFTMYVFVRAVAAKAAGTAEPGRLGRTIGL